MIKDLVRREIKEFDPYKANQIPHEIKLDANESPFDLPEKIRKKVADFFLKGPDLNLYPDTDSIELRKTLAPYWKVDYENIVVGTGSDQLIQVIINVFVEKGDKVVCPVPSFGMYKINTIIGGGIPVEIPLKKERDFAYDIDQFIHVTKREKAKIVFLCNPNNPTGGSISKENIEKIAKECPDAVIVVDEAYAEFLKESSAGLLSRYENLVILRTFSKAYGLAGLRCGYSISGLEMANEISKVKPPYNISSLSQYIAMLTFKEREIIDSQVEYLIEQREYLMGELEKMEKIHVYPSEANFICFEVPDAPEVCKKLEEKGILIRGFGKAPILGNCARVSIGNKEQNNVLLKELQKCLK
ncbi:histidinol-phosphate transaminase [Herbivorax sp. ANBcel31]|uniref:histidinol-phosphate transaminase n=1 Tax=Herbivorax sp. ANBcel31 TaxID=3069754 RepID=UPI0027B2F281|nr:histidinol-phosphate transaminase [Herbivorax sp. ANBcel31]MDQ2087690.1 histidinol-phosphate transaminase [Herbivorax sp. ANBcel31]